MKRLIGLILAVSAMATVGRAANTVVYNGVMQSTTGIPASSLAGAATQQYTMDLLGPTGSGGDIIGAQLNYASATVANATFTDGSVSTFTITVLSTSAVVPVADLDTITVAVDSGLAAAPASASVSIASNSANLSGGIIGSTLTVVIGLPMGGTVAQSSFTFIGNLDYQVGASSNATATNLASSINYKLNQLIASFTGFASNATAGLKAAVNPVGGSTVTLTANQNGSFANNWVITTTTATALPVVKFSSGQDNASYSFFSPYTASTITLTNGVQWNSDPVYSSNTAVAIANAWNTTGGYGITAATTAATVVTFTANKVGAWANADAFFTSTAALKADNTSSVGQNAATIQIGSNLLTIGSQLPLPLVASTTVNLASGIANYIHISSMTLGFDATSVSSVVFATATAVGVGQPIASSTQTALTIGPFTSSSPVTGIATGTSFGGSAAAYILVSGSATVLALANHQFTNGYAVYLSTSSGVKINGLNWGTTYYAIVVDANDISLASSQANALAGTAITLTSSQTKTTADTFTLVASTPIGSAQFTLQGSNDGVNFSAITTGWNGATISPVNFPSPYTAGSTVFPIGFYPYRYLRLLYQGQTWGGSNWSLWLLQKTGST